MAMVVVQEPEVVEQVYRMTGEGEGIAELHFKEALSISLSIPDDPSGDENVTICNMRDKVAGLLRDAASNYRQVCMMCNTPFCVKV